jgi:hypothetical protein
MVDYKWEARDRLYQWLLYNGDYTEADLDLYMEIHDGELESIDEVAAETFADIEAEIAYEENTDIWTRADRAYQAWKDGDRNDW